MIQLKKTLSFCSAAFVTLAPLYAQHQSLSYPGSERYLIDRIQTLNGAFDDSISNTVTNVDMDIEKFVRWSRQNGGNSPLSNADFKAINNTESNTGLKTRNSKCMFSLASYAVLDVANNQSEDKVNFNTSLGVRGKFDYIDKVKVKFGYTYINETTNDLLTQEFLSKQTYAGTNNYTYKGDNKFRYHIPTFEVAASILPNRKMTVAVGHDYQRIGDGYRTLMLSEYSGPISYLKLNTRVWKLNYQNLYAMINQDNVYNFPHSDVGYPKQTKFFTAHHLSVNVTKWLNIGAYEMIVFSRDNGYEIGYLNPIIFYRSIERSLGSPDKAVIGLNAKALPIKNVQLYGQFIINEFTAKEFFGNNGYMHNKWGAQLGGKYFNAFNVENLDIRVEGNVTRPYTFQHRFVNGEIGANFANNGLPLGSELGAGYKEFVTQVRYQPFKKWILDAKYDFYEYGLDFDGKNYGNNIGLPYDYQIPHGYGVKMINGSKAYRQLVNFNISYELAKLVHLDLGATYSYHKYTPYINPEQNLASEYTRDKNTYFHFGIRLNAPRRDFSYK